MNKNRMDFLFLNFILLALNLPWWDNSIWWAASDSAFVGQSFYAFYNEFFYHHHLAQWLPFGTYGIGAGHWQIFDLSAPTYLVGPVSALLRIQNALLVFKWSLFAEQAIMLMGMYLFSKLLFKNRFTTLFVCIGLIGSTVWLLQVYWNFRIYYLLPLVLYLTLKGVKERQIHYLFMVFAAEIISLLGVPAYFAIVHFFIVAFFFIGALLEYQSLKFEFKPISRSLSWLCFGLMVVGIYFLFLRMAYRGIYFTTGFDRSHESHFQTSITSFLEHGISGTLHGIPLLTQLIFPTLIPKNLGGAHLNVNEVTSYIGILPLFFVVLSVLLCLKRCLYGLWFLSTLFMVLLSLGDGTPFARFAYETILPVRYLRNLGNLPGVCRFLLIVLGGFGLDAFLSSRKNLNREVILSFLLMVSACTALAGFNQRYQFLTMQWPQFYILAFVFLTLAVAGLVLKKTKLTRLKIFLLIVLCCDFIGYQTLVWANWGNHWNWVDPSVKNVEPLKFQMQRTMNYDTTRRTTGAFKVVEMNMTRAGIASHGFLQFDPCLTPYLTRFWPAHVHEFFESRWNAIVKNGFSLLSLVDHPDRDNFIRATGCWTGKLRYVPNVICEATHKDAVDRFKQIPNLMDTMVVESASACGASGHWEADSLDTASVQIEEFSFNDLQLSTQVAGGGAWLYYADTYDPGWKAMINGREAPLLKANLAFKALWVPAGTQRIHLIYDDKLQVFLSYCLAILGLFFSVAAIFFLFQKAVPLA